MSPSTPPSHSYLWPSGAPFSAPSLSLSVPVTTEPPVPLPLTSSLPVQWSWDEEHYHTDAAPLGVQERWVMFADCVCATKMCVPASLLATDLDSVPSFKSLVLNWWKGAFTDSQAVLCGLESSPSPMPVNNRSHLVYCLQIFPVHECHPPT